ncbi:MAG: GNAT family N-acetyltransferase, partial [Nanoarchaeota archaeon]|nr:GNAT family N-acetyltransferase [Nanoarchaeota archaeon]
MRASKDVVQELMSERNDALRKQLEEKYGKQFSVEFLNPGHEHIQAMIDLDKEAYVNDPALEDKIFDSEDFEDVLDDPTGLGLFIHSEGKPVGYILAKHDSEELSPDMQDGIYYTSVAVAKEHQGSVVFPGLVALLEEAAREAGFDRAMLHAHDNPRLLTTMGKLGYRQRQFVSGYHEDDDSRENPEDDVWILTKDLTDPEGFLDIPIKVELKSRKNRQKRTEINYDNIPANLRRKIGSLYERVSALETRCREERSRAMEAGNPHPYDDHMTFKSELRGAMATTIEDIVNNAPDRKTLHTGLTVLETYLRLSEGRRRLRLEKNNNPHVWEDGYSPARKHRLLAYHVMKFFDRMPETIDQVAETGMTDEFRRLVKGANNMMLNAATKTYNFSNIGHAPNYFVYSKNWSCESGIAVLARMRDAGFSEYIDDIISMVNQPIVHEAMHFWSEFRRIDRYLLDAKSRGYEEEIRSMFAAAKRITWNGSSQCTMLRSLNYISEYDRLGHREAYSGANRIIERIAGKNAYFAYGFHDGAHFFKEYAEKGLADRFLEILDLAARMHEDDEP